MRPSLKMQTSNYNIQNCIQKETTNLSHSTDANPVAENVVTSGLRGSAIEYVIKQLNLDFCTPKWNVALGE